MEKLGKETRFLLGGITVTCIISILLTFEISSAIVKEFQKAQMLHDYSVAGYLLNHTGDVTVSAFTAGKSKKDIEQGRKAMTAIGYSEKTAISLLPSVLKYRNRVMLILFCALLFVFSAIYSFIFIYLNKQHKVLKDAGTSIRDFLNGNTMSRIDSEQIGEWYSFFHEVNELSAILSAHAENEKQMKEFLQDIISDVSHQLKTPLSALKMYYEIINDDVENKEAVNNFSAKSLREIKRIEDVIYTLLKLARLDAGIIRMEKMQEHISDIVQDVLERFEIWAKRENKSIEVHGDSDIMLYCDALWMLEALGNIVKNALEHTVSGGHIVIQWEQTPLVTQIKVEDDGKGIHPEDLYNIFKRFYRSRFSQDIRGIGLGLPLAKTIVENHGGTVSVTSKIDVGTILTLNFFNLTNK